MPPKGRKKAAVVAVENGRTATSEATNGTELPETNKITRSKRGPVNDVVDSATVAESNGTEKETKISESPRTVDKRNKKAKQNQEEQHLDTEDLGTTNGQPKSDNVPSKRGKKKAVNSDSVDSKKEENKNALSEENEEKLHLSSEASGDELSKVKNCTVKIDKLKKGAEHQTSSYSEVQESDKSKELSADDMPAKKGRKNATKTDKLEKDHLSNDKAEESNVKDVVPAKKGSKRAAETKTTAKETLSDVQVPIIETKEVKEKNIAPSKKGKKAAEAKYVTKEENSSEIDVPLVDEAKDEQNKAPSTKGKKKATNTNLVAKDENPSDLKAPIIDETKEVEEKVAAPSKKGKKKAVSTNTDAKEENSSDIQAPVADKAGQTALHRKGRKKAEPVTNMESSIDDKVPITDDVIKESDGESTAPSRRGRKRAAEIKPNAKENVCDIEIPSTESDANNIDPPSKKNRRNVAKTESVAKKEDSNDARVPLNVDEPASSDAAPVKRGRRNAPRTESVESSSDKSEAAESTRGRRKLPETKNLKIALRRSPSLDQRAEEEAKVMEEESAALDMEEESAVLDKAVKTAKGSSSAASSKGKRKQKETEDDSQPAKKSKDKASTSKREKIPDVTALDFDNKSVSPDGHSWNFKIASWNINGVRAWLEKNGMSYLQHESPDVMCIQETKCSNDKLPEELRDVEGYKCYWLSGDKDGYSGVGLLSKKEPISVKYGIDNKEHDTEGRVITAEYEDFYVVATYVPNAGRGLKRLDYRMQFDKDFHSYLKKLDETKPVILCGDLNVAHNEIDLANPKTNKRNAGFTQEERDSFTSLLSEGFVDSFRHLYPDTKGAYTFWTYMMNARAKNVGWRLDYFVISEKLVNNLCDNVIRSEVMGSDHCPVGLFLYI